MYKNLFLESSPKQGKSTLLLNCIASHLQDGAGFFCQRLIDDCGLTVAYRLVAPESAEPLNRGYDKELPGIFLSFIGNKITKDQDVFEKTAISCLQAAKDKTGRKKKFILMDEIGGIELLNTKFIRAVYDALQGELPCIGVVKARQSLLNMVASNMISPKCIEVGEKLRKVIYGDGRGQIITFCRETSEQTEDEVRRFIEAIYT